MLKIKTWVGKNKLASIGLSFVGLIALCCICLGGVAVISPPDRDSGGEAIAPAGTRERSTASPTRTSPSAPGETTAPIAPVATLDVMATATYFAQQVEETQTAELPAATAQTPVGEQPESGAVYGIAKDNLNVRSGPGANYEIVGKLLAGERIEITATSPDRAWLEHRKGWSATEFLNIEGDVSQLGIVEAPAPTVADTPLPPPTEDLPTAIPSAQSANCDPSYPDFCLPPSSANTLNCGDIPYRRFRVLPPDPHQFDGNFDGVGCESD